MFRYALLMALLAASLPAAAVYKWVDEDGKTHYGDRVPPQYAKQQREEVNKQGLTTKTYARQKTPEELAAEKKAREDAEAEAKAKKEQEEQDRNLVQTYPTLETLEEARADRRKLIESNFKMAQQARDGTNASLQKLLERKAAAEKNGGKAPPALLKQIKDHEKSLKQTDDAIAKLNESRATMEAKFEADHKRYLEITNRAQLAAPASTATPASH